MVDLLLGGEADLGYRDVTATDTASFSTDLDRSIWRC